MNYELKTSGRLLFMALLLLATNTQASNYYGFKIGGVAVNSDNYLWITGEHIKQNVEGENWYVWYDRDEKTVTLRNVKIIRTGTDSRAIFNESCEGLTVKLIGDNILSSESAAPVRLQKNTTIEVETGTTTITGGSEDGIYITNQSTVNFIGEGSLVVNATSSSAIEGSSTSDRPTVNFMGPNITLEGKGGDLVDVIATFNDSYTNSEGMVRPHSNVTLKATDDYSHPNVKNSSISLCGTPASVILEPWDATISSGSIIINNVRIYGRDIVIGNCYAALITEDYFPDAKFREQLLARYPKYYITDDDVSQCTSLELIGKGISSLTGISYFTALKKLTCRLNYMSTLNVSANTELTELDCSICGLNSLTLGNNTKLKTLDCSSNHIGTLNLGGCTALTSLICNENSLSSLTVSANKSLITLNCHGNNLTSLNLVNNKALTSLNVSHNQLTDLSLTNQTKLKTLYCTINKLTTLDIANLTMLEELDCYNNQLTSLDCSGKTALKTLSCATNQLTSLNVSGCSALTSLDCDYNQFSTLSVTNLPALTFLDCSNNPQLLTLNCYENPKLATLWMMSEQPQLQTLDCHGCALTSISIPSTSSFCQLTCYQNDISGTAMDNLVARLYDRTGMTKGQLIVMANASDELNTCTEQQALEAVEKNWSVLYDNGTPLYNFTPTAVQYVAVPQQQQSPLFNLQGQRVPNGYKGLVIKNGKKAVVK